MAKLSGALTATGASGAISPSSRSSELRFTFGLSGTWAGTVDLERSSDGGATWPEVVETYTANTSKNAESPSSDYSYRLNCSAFTSGTINWVLATR